MRDFLRFGYFWEILGINMVPDLGLDRVFLDFSNVGKKRGSGGKGECLGLVFV